MSVYPSELLLLSGQKVLAVLICPSLISDGYFPGFLPVKGLWFLSSLKQLDDEYRHRVQVSVEGLGLCFGDYVSAELPPWKVSMLLAHGKAIALGKTLGKKIYSL